MAVRDSSTKLATESTGVPGKIYGYMRVSHKSSVLSGHGLDVQRAGIENYVAGLVARRPELSWGQMFQDDAVSAWKIPFANRVDGGRPLDKLLSRGDHVVFYRSDRAFRRLRDTVNQVEAWIERGIAVHFADQGIDVTTPAGRMVLHMMGAMAEHEAAIASVRNREVCERMRMRGRPSGGHPPLGFKWSGKRGRLKRLVPDPAVRRIMQEIVRMRDNEKLPFRVISDRLEMAFAQQENRPYRSMAWRSGWQLKRCWCAYYAEKNLKKLERSNQRKLEAG